MKGALALRIPCGAAAALDTSSTNVLSSTYVDLVTAANMSSACSAIMVSNAGSQPLILATGAAGSEVKTGAVIPPTSYGVTIPIQLKKGVRLSLQSLAGTQSSGFVSIMFLQ